VKALTPHSWQACSQIAKPQSLLAELRLLSASSLHAKAHGKLRTEACDVAATLAVACRDVRLYLPHLSEGITVAYSMGDHRSQLLTARRVDDLVGDIPDDGLIATKAMWLGDGTPSTSSGCVVRCAAS
jgi:hypothetical protein